MKLLSLINASSILLFAALAPAAHADIYKCADEYGNVAYLQTPCPVVEAAEPSATEDDDPPTVEAVPDEKVKESLPEPQSSAPQVVSSRRPGEKVDDCKKRYRDQIDAIDAEMRTGFSPEKGAAYKKSLLTLTSQLRACE